MGIVADFAQSGDAGWNVTRMHKAFVSNMIMELDEYPEVILVMSHDTTALINKSCIRVKVVENGARDTESQLQVS